MDSETTLTTYWCEPGECHAVYVGPVECERCDIDLSDKRHQVVNEGDDFAVYSLCEEHALV